MKSLNLKKKPFFSVITVVKNDEKNISKTIKSIKNQNFSNFEYIVIDGKSSDDTLSEILKYKKYINVISSKKDKGLYYAMNKGAQISKGYFIVFVNSGDKLTKNALKIVYNEIKNHDDLDFVFGTVKRHYTKSTIIKTGFDINRLMYNFDFATSHSTGFFVKRKRFKQIGFFNTKYKCSADYDVYFKLIINNKLLGSYTKKNQLIGEVVSGGFSSKISFFEHLFEETRIRLDNKQNFFFVTLIFINALVKKFIKLIFQ